MAAKSDSWIGARLRISSSCGVWSEKECERELLQLPYLPEFRGASCAERYNLHCKRLMQEKLYSSAALLLSPRSAGKTGKYVDLSELTSIRGFFAGFTAGVAVEEARREPKYLCLYER